MLGENGAVHNVHKNEKHACTETELIIMLQVTV